MARPSKLTDAQWTEIGTRLLQGEQAASLAREFVVGTVALAGPLIDAKAESYASDFNGNLDDLISEIQGAFSSMHKQTIADAHEDFEALVDSPEFQAYLSALPEDQKAKADATVESGSAGAAHRVKLKVWVLIDAGASDVAVLHGRKGLQIDGLPENPS